MTGLILAVVLAQSYYTPEEAKAVFNEATQAYSKDDYVAAEAGFRKLLDRGHGGPDVLFSLGTTLLAKGDLGPAILELERAKRLAPGDDAIEANLALAHSRRVDQVEGAEGPFLQRFVDSTSPTTVGWGFLGLWLAAFGLVFLRRLRPERERRLLAVLAAAGFLAALPLGLGLAAHGYVRETYREAIVLPASAQAKDLPRPGGKTAFEVHAGLKVRILEEADGFLRIRLPNGLEGWTARAEIAEI